MQWGVKFTKFKRANKFRENGRKRRKKERNKNRASNIVDGDQDSGGKFAFFLEIIVISLKEPELEKNQTFSISS